MEGSEQKQTERDSNLAKPNRRLLKTDQSRSNGMDVF